MIKNEKESSKFYVSGNIHVLPKNETSGSCIPFPLTSIS